MHSTLTYSLVFIDFGCKIITFPRNKQIFCKKFCFFAYIFIKITIFADDNNIIQQVFFLGGCNGNLQGISQLVRGQHIDDVMKRLNGIRCGAKGTSCPDQLCRALEQLKNAPIEEK